jgi:protein gp37
VTDTTIEWTDRTWNPVRGCSMAPGSELKGCLNCYAARLAARGLPWSKGLARQTANGPRWTGKVELIPSKLDEPLRWRAGANDCATCGGKGKARGPNYCAPCEGEPSRPLRVFVNSMSDLFHEGLASLEIERVFETMVEASQHTFQVLTKRPSRMLDWVRWWLDRGSDESVGYTARMPPNVWLGVSVEDQATADERIPLLLQTPAAVRFVSYEPALGPVAFDISRWGECYHPRHDGRDHEADHRDCSCHLDWVIVGGESGPGARPFDVAWARSTVEQCKAAGVAVFVKQLGAKPWEPVEGVGPMPMHLASKKGGDPSEWPADLRVREFPAVRS